MDTTSQSTRLFCRNNGYRLRSWAPTAITTLSWHSRLEKPPGLPTGSIVATPAAAPAPDRNLLGIAHSGVFVALIPTFMITSANTIINAVAGEHETDARQRIRNHHVPCALPGTRRCSLWQTRLSAGLLDSHAIREPIGFHQSAARHRDNEVRTGRWIGERSFSAEA